MRNFCTKCAYIVILEFVLVSAGFSNTLTLNEQGEVFAETDRYRVRFRDGVLIHFHNKLTNETYTLPPQDDSNEQSGISIQYSNEGGYGKYIHIDEHWELVESQRLTPLSVEVAYYSDYRVDKTVWIRISIDVDTGDLVIQQHGTSERVVSIMWGCRYLNPQQLDVIVPGNCGEIIDAATEANERGYEYPERWEAQLAILQGGDGGFYVRSTDTSFRFKSAGYRRTAEHFSMRFQTDNFAPFGDKDEITSVAWRLNAYRGDWHVPARIYRDWMETTFQPTPPPAWVKDIEVVIYLNLREDVLPELAKHVNPSTTLIYLLGWQRAEKANIPTPRPEFGAFLDAAHAYGFRVMPYTNVVSMSPDDPLYPEFEKYQLRHPFRGHKLGYRWDDPSYPDSVAYINPASKAFRKYTVAQHKKVYEAYPIDGFHLDINTLFRNDPNGLVDGLTFPEGNILMHQELREAMPGIVLGGENVHEGTFFNTNLAQRWCYNNKQPHPISSFLFSTWTIPYGYHVPNPDGEPELYRPFQEAYIVWGVLPTIRIRAPWLLRDPVMVKTQSFLKSVLEGQTWEQTWNIDIVGIEVLADVNVDGIVNVLDLVIVAQHIGTEKSSNPRVDVNGDGVVNILDLVVVAQEIG